MDPVLLEPCELLPWDSKFFGITIARVRADTLTPGSRAAIERWCLAREVRCLYFIARPDDSQTVKLAETDGYHLADVRMTFALDMAAASAPMATDRRGPSRHVRRATEADLPALRRIARLSHTDTRFFYDDRFPRPLCESLYEVWIQSSYEGFAQGILVAEDGGELAGFVTCHLAKNGEDGSIGLIAVDADRQGKGIGRALVDGARDWLAERKIQRVSVVTQGRNVAGQRLYARCGFLPRKLELYYHRWFPEVGTGAH